MTVIKPESDNRIFKSSYNAIMVKFTRNIQMLPFFLGKALNFF